MRYKIIIALCIGYVLWFTIQPVETCWSETDIQLAVGIAGLSVIGTTVLMLRKQIILLSKIDVVVCLWFSYLMLRAYCDTTYPCANFCLRSIQMFTLYLTARLFFSSIHISEKVLVIGILLCAGYEVIVGADQLINGNSRHYLYALSGTFLNPGPYSAFLSMGLIMSCKLRKGYWLPVIFLILLPATWSRAALVSAAICLGIIYWNKWKQRKWQVAIGVIVIIVGLYFLKKGSADGRSIIYFISLLCIAQSPIFGSGIGSFCHQYAERMNSFYIQHPTFNFQSADVTEGAFNSFLQIGVEQGLIGMSLATALIILLLIKLKEKGEVLRMGVLCLLIFSMFSYPFDLLPYQIIFVLIAAYAASEDKEFVPSTKWHQLSRRFIVPIAALICILTLSFFSYCHTMERKKAESDYQMMAGVAHVDFIDDYYELLPYLRNNPHYLFDFGKMLAKDGRYSDSNAMLRLGTLISNDPMFYVIQGNNYVKMELYHEAERAYQKAFNIMPNRIYPLYRLMLLYKEKGDITRMKNMAHKIASFKVKVVSPATKEIQEKAKQVLNK